MAKVVFDKDLKSFIWKGSFEEKLIPKRAGFMWNPISREWETKKKSKAYFLKEFFDQSAREQFLKNTLIIDDEGPKSLKIPKHQALKDFQVKGAYFALSRNHSYLAFEQGLGKTPTAICIANSLNVETLIICPAFLVDNWKSELSEWSFKGEGESIDNGKDKVLKFGPIIILPDSLLDRPAIHDFLLEREFELLIVDEAHRFKNFESKRAQNLFEKICGRIENIVCLSGTPMPNRPAELYPVVSTLAANVIDYQDFHNFGVEYCNAFETRFGWEYRGASNLDKLHNKLKSFMFRVTKAEVLPELLPKEERIIKLTPPSKIVDLAKKEQSVMGKHFKVDKIIEKKNLGEIATYRKMLGVAKVPLVSQYIESVFEAGEENLLVFAWHLEVIESLKKKFPDAEVITGGTPKDERTEIVQNFQVGKIKILIAQIQTMVGLNLTRADRVIFAEFSWSPSDNEQAMDRAHRIGQKNSLTVDYLVLAKTLDAHILDRLKEKKKVIKQVI